MTRTTAESKLWKRRPFPHDLWNQLSSIDVRLLDELAYLCHRQAKTSPSGAPYCRPGRRYLATKLGCSVETITRHTRKLSSLGMLLKTQRRPTNGIYHTNLYRLIHWVAWRAAAIRHYVARVAHRRPKLAAKASATPPTENRDRRSQEFDRILRRFAACADPPSTS